MLENIQFLAVPIIACVLLAGMLAYFGNHILTRGIIFIDIALAQIAALGTMIGILLGFADESFSVEAVSMIFTLVVISLFALTKFEKQRIPQEAIIGIIYGLSLGIAMLFAEYIPGGSNYITKTITGNILWCTWGHLKSCFLTFAAIGIVHIFLGRHFIKISEAKDRFPFSPKKVRILELVFYITFGTVIVKAVPVGGIFLVFTLLIAPTSIATLFTRRWRYRFIWSWLIGIIGSVAGMVISYNLDISNGPAIVCLLGLLVFILAFGKIVFGKSKRIA
ncbi:MAG: metal ABC transporter permease [Candidatus Glassbacteria bacterium]|nr:metal ABC transporter permease [Candidatus Glassbacteria bacterium]